MEEECERVPLECEPPLCPRAKLTEGARAKASAAVTAMILIMGSPTVKRTLAPSVQARDILIK